MTVVTAFPAPCNTIQLPNSSEFLLQALSGRTNARVVPKTGMRRTCIIGGLLKISHLIIEYDRQQSAEVKNRIIKAISYI